MKLENKCSQCPREYVFGENYCPECGTKREVLVKKIGAGTYDTKKYRINLKKMHENIDKLKKHYYQWEEGEQLKAVILAQDARIEELEEKEKEEKI